VSRGRRPASLKRAALPALHAFARGYLHEDVHETHGSAEAALAAFWKDASPDERRRFLTEITRVADATARWSVRDLQQFLAEEIGSAWIPSSSDEFVALARAATAAARRTHP
jgi:contact-dependent growth inhibition (CDI) system CdiI-like immunity protein